MPSHNSREKASWRDSRAPRKNGNANVSVRSKRVFTTIFTLLTLAGIISLAVYLLTRHDARAHLVWLNSSNNVSGTLPPLSYTTETKGLYGELTKTKEKRFTFEDGKNVHSFEQQIRNAIKEQKLVDEDVLIIAIRQHGIELDGKPYLVLNEYKLTDDISDRDNLVEFSKLLKAAALHNGKTLFLLDWGKVVYDARIGAGNNLFIHALSNLVSKEANKNIWILASHSNRQISHDVTPSIAGTKNQDDGFSLFHLACAEALLVRLESLSRDLDELNLEDPKGYFSTLASIAEYVSARVVERSNAEQTPLLFQCGRGQVRAYEEDELSQAKAFHVVPLDRSTARPIGLKKLEPIEKASVSSEPPNQPVDQLPSISPANKLWALLDEWSKPKPELANWSISQLLPGAAKELAAHAVRLEMRYLAGKDYAQDSIVHVAVEQADIAEAVEALHSSAENLQKIAINRFKADDATRELFDQDNSFGTLQSWRASTESIQAYRVLAMQLSEAAKIIAQFRALNEETIVEPLQQSLNQSLESIQAWLPVWNSAIATTTSVESVDWRELAGNLQQNSQDLRNSIDEVFAKLVTNRSVKTIPRTLTDVLLQSSLLTLEQRTRLHLARETLSPGKDLRLRDIDPRIWPMNNNTEDLQLSILFNQSTLSTDPELESLASSSDVVITASKLIRNKHRQGIAGVELSWLLLDNRDFVDSEWRMSDPSEPYLKSQLPILPSKPNAPPQWDYQFVDAATNQPLSGQRLRFSESTEIKRVILRLTHSGGQSNVESLEITTKNLQCRLGSSGQVSVNRNLTITADDWDDIAKLNGASYDILMQFQPNPNLAADDVLLANFNVAFDNVESVPMKLDVSIKNDRPLELIVEQQLFRNEERIWEPADSINSVSTLRPFPGRSNPVQFKLKNSDSEDIEVSVDLFALPAPRSLRPIGRLAANGDLLDGVDSFAENILTRIASVDTLTVQASQIQRLSFKTPETSTETNTPVATQTESKAATDVNNGLVAIVRDKKSNRSWKYWLQCVPLNAGMFLKIDSQSQGRSKNQIRFTVRLRDDGRDGKVDLLPSDFSKDKPIDLEWVTWRWSNPVQGITQMKINETGGEATFSTTSESEFPNNVTLFVSVDGNPRALIYEISPGGIQSAVPKEDFSGYLVQRVAQMANAGRVYDRNELNLPKENGIDLDTMDAIFPGQVQDPIKILLNVDAALDSLDPDKLPKSYTFASSLGDRKVFFGDRSIGLTLETIDDSTFDLGCKVSDHEFEFTTLKGSSSIDDPLIIANDPIPQLKKASIVLDGTPPSIKIVKSIPNGPIYEDSKVVISFTVDDRSPIREVSVKLNPSGSQDINPIKPMPIKRLVANNGQSYSDTYEIDLASAKELVIGKAYDVVIQAIDQNDNKKEEKLTGYVRIQKRPEAVKPSGDATPVPSIKGNVKGSVMLGTSSKPHASNNSQNKVTIKELGKSTELKDGRFEFKDIEAGTYTLVASINNAGQMYEGEEPLVLKKPEDYSKEWNVSAKSK